MQNHSQPKLERRLAAVLFADVQGYSRLIGEDEEGAHLETFACIEIFERKISDFGGRVVRTSGDGLLIDIPSATDAVKFAVEVQKAIAERNTALPVEKRVEFRIGINVGEVIHDRGEVYGDAVNVAARLQSLAYPGGVCITRAVHDQVGSKLGYGFEFMGSQDLKNILHPVDVFRVRPVADSMLSLPTFRAPVLEPAVPALPSIAVLPFANLTENANEAFLSDGITEDVTVALSRFRELFVIARHSAFVYKTRQSAPPEIARELGVRYLVEGSVRREGARLRVTARLIEAVSGQEIWGERYDHFVDEVFDVMDDLTERVAATLARQVQAAERRRAVQTKPENLEAYGLVLRGQEQLMLIEKNANTEARRHYERAAQIDPGYARAYAAISRSLNYDWRYSWSQDAEQSLHKALEFANKAIEIDDYDARAFAELGFVQLYNKEHNASIAAYERSLELNPNDAEVLAEMGDALSHISQSPRAVEKLKRAMRLNPYYPDSYLWYLAGAFYQMHQYEDAIEQIEKMKNPAEGNRLLAASCAQLGRMKEAKAAADRVMKVHPEFSIAHWSEILPDRDSEDAQHYIEGLRKAGLK